MDISVPIVGYVFVCIIYPRIVKSKSQFYMAFAVLLGILVLDVIISLGVLARFFTVLRGVLWIVDFILLVLATGGLSLHELTGELQGAFEVMRRGETTKTVIVPLQRGNPEDPRGSCRRARGQGGAKSPARRGRWGRSRSIETSLQGGAGREP